MNNKNLKQQIFNREQELASLRKQLAAAAAEEQERKQFLSSKEIIALVQQNTGRTLNMSTIKRWADEGFLGTVLDEKQAFPNLPAKQGKKRFLYPKKEVYSFLYEKGYVHPAFQVLDQALLDFEKVMVVDSTMRNGEFSYTVQKETTFDVLRNIPESNLRKEGEQNESENENG